MSMDGKAPKEDGVYLLDFGRKCGLVVNGELMATWSVEPYADRISTSGTRRTHARANAGPVNSDAGND